MLGGKPTQQDQSPASPLEALHGVPWLRGVPAATLERLAEQAILHSVPAGAGLFGQAETPTFAQFLIRGSVELIAVRGETESLVETVRPIDIILSAAVLTGQPYLLAARVLEEARVLLVAASAFRAAVAEDHDLCLAVLACQAAHSRRQLRQAKAVRLRSADERIGARLLRLAEESGARAARLPHEKQLIASQLGISRETFSRALPLMARCGLRVEGDVLHVDDLAAARAAFPPDPLIDGPEPIDPAAIARR